MAGIAYKDVAEVLSGIANTVYAEHSKNPENAPLVSLTVKLALLIDDWLDEHPEKISELYDKKLDFIED